MRTRRSYFPLTAMIPCRSRKQTTNVVEPEIRTNVEMADNRTMAQMLQAPIEGYEDAIVVPPINANNFKLKQTLIKGEARIWLDKEPPRSILTWEDLVSKFINQFFPLSKTTYLQNEIINFLQKPNETFNEAWERFKGLLRQCPHHSFSELHQLDTFYNVLNPNDQDALDSAAGGNFLDRITHECLSIIESKSKEERIKREHAEYINHMEMLCTINPRPRPMVNINTIVDFVPSSPIPLEDGGSQREEIDIVIDTNDVLPLSVESNDDSEAEINDDPSFPRPPPEPPNDKFDLEPDSGEVILVVIKAIDEPKKEESFDPGGEIYVSTKNEDVDYFPLMFVMRIFLPYIIHPEVSPLFFSAASEDAIFDPVTVLTVKQKLARKNELKTHGTLLMALSDKHQLKFNSNKDAKILMEAIEKSFGGNTETKKVQKTLLKQKFENFTGSSSEDLDQIHDRLHKLVSQLKIHGVSLSQEDVNLKFFRSLPSEWKTYTLIWRNKVNLEEHSLDDLFNSLKIYETRVRHSFSTSNPTQNLAFVSSSNTDSTTDSVSVATSVSSICAKLHVSSHPNIDSLSNAVIFSFFASQSTNPLLDNEDLKQIDVDDLEEMDLRWQMAMLTKRARRFLQKTGRNLGDNRVTTMGFDISPKNTRRTGGVEPHRRTAPVETSTSNALVSQCDGIRSYDWSYQEEEEPANFALMAIPSSSSSDNEAALESVESRLFVYKQNESILQENIIVLKNEVEARDNFILTLKQKLKKAETERDDLKLKFENFQSSSKSLTELIASQTNNKHGLGYLSLEDDYESVSLTCPSDRLSPSGGYHVSPAKPTQAMSHTTESMAHIIEDWVSDSKDESKPNNPQSTKPTPRNYVHRGIDKQHVTFSYKYPQKHKVHAVVLPKSKPVSVTAVRPVSAAVPKIMKSRPNYANTINTKSKSTTRRHKTRGRFSKTSNSSSRVTVAKAQVVSAHKGKKGKWGNPQYALKDKGVIDSGCSRHMTRNMYYLSNFQELNGGYVTFGGNPKGGKISGKGKIKTGKLDFEDVYFVKELKFNLFSVLQMCDKKNKVLFTDFECLVLSSDFKLADGNQVLLKVPRENNMYNVNLKDIAPFGDLTCLFAKATVDESNLWHRRLGHINFKTINKLVKGNLVRGLPTKVLEYHNTCVACKKGKQHKVSCKTKPISFVNQPLFRQHMDLFGQTFVKSINKKRYCLVITNDYSRFTWVFFLATKDETGPTLKNFITGLENQLSLKVKVIRSDNGTEFKIFNLNQFCGIKGIKREFSVPKTPQENGIAERKNRTLIEAARTMLANSLLPIPFWAEAVNTACYVQNMVLVTKPHNKTPYELLHGRTPSIGFMRPFGCPVTILNTLDSLDKFEGKVDEGFLVRYSVNSKAFRVFNSRTRIIQETLHVTFLENKPNVEGTGPTWLFDIDSLTRTMNYQPVTTRNQTNPSAGDATFDEKEHDAEKPESAVNLSLSRSALLGERDDMTKKKVKGKSHVEHLLEYRDLNAVFEDFFKDSSNDVIAAGPIVPAVGHNYSNITNPISAAGPSNSKSSPTHGQSSLRDTYQPPDMVEGEDFIYSNHENVGAEADFNNLEISITVRNSINKNSQCSSYILNNWQSVLNYSNKKYDKSH
nr:putative ribonuclease H-like domain-containing protein [Tanacetum cinerariifolium]